MTASLADPPSRPPHEDAASAAIEETPAAPPALAVGVSQRIWSVLNTKPARAIGSFLLIAAIPYAHPSLKSLRLITREHNEVLTQGGPTGIAPEYGELNLHEATNEKPPILEDNGNEPPAQMVAPAGSAPPQLSELAVAVGAQYRPIEDPSNHAMDGFFASLKKTDAGTPGAITRVAHYGDSLVVSDFMSSTLRRRFQLRFGDAGHGFVLMAKPWAWYFHQDVSHWSSDGWKTHRIVNPRIADELYGYGGATFRTAEGGTKSTFGTAKPIPGVDPKNEKEAFGRRVSKFEVHYLEQPDGGSFDLLLDGKKQQTVSTRRDSKKLAVARVATEDGEHTLEIKAQGGAEARFFGVVLERDVAGVVWDALGVNGGRARILDVNEEAHWAESLRARGPALVILQYGTNESEDTGYPQDQYEATLEAVLRQVKVALPDASCLVIGAMDRAGHGIGGMETRPIIPRLVESQRKVAFKVGCAFWDTYLAMGGPGAMGRWSKATPKLGGGDLTHPTMAGATLLGDLLYAALMQGYSAAH
jgi:lysophospholipase L1-like esterase